MVSWAKDMTDLARLVAYLHNNMLLMRRFSSFRPRIPLLNLMLRSLYLKKVSRVKQAKNKVKALNPTTEFLFIAVYMTRVSGFYGKVDIHQYLLVYGVGVCFEVFSTKK